MGDNSFSRRVKVSIPNSNTQLNFNLVQLIIVSKPLNRNTTCFLSKLPWHNSYQPIENI